MANVGLRWQAGRPIDTRKAFPSRSLSVLLSWYDTRYTAYISKAYPSRLLSLLLSWYTTRHRVFI